MNVVNTRSLIEVDCYFDELNTRFEHSGYAVIRPSEHANSDEFAQFARHFGKPVVNTRTNDHGIFEVGIGKTPFVNEDVNETRYAEKHTDGLTFVANPDVSFLRCVTSDAGGAGHNRIYDARKTLIKLASESERMFRALTTPVIELFGGNAYRPILQICAISGRAKFFFNDDNLPNEPDINKISAVINDLSYERVLLRTGDVLVLNNACVLHGREEFSDVKRHMQRIIVELNDTGVNRLQSGFEFSPDISVPWLSQIKDA